MTSRSHIFPIALIAIAIVHAGLSRGDDVMWQEPVIMDAAEGHDLLVSPGEVQQLADESAHLRFLVEKRIGAACFFDCLASIGALPSTPSNNLESVAIAPLHVTNTVTYPVQMIITVTVKNPHDAKQSYVVSQESSNTEWRVTGTHPNTLSIPNILSQHEATQRIPEFRERLRSRNQHNKSAHVTR